MASITIRGLEDSLKAKLRARATSHGRSMEDEARAILLSGLTDEGEQKPNFAEAIRRHVADLGGVKLQLPKREPVRRPPEF